MLGNPHAPTATVAGMLQAGPATIRDGRYAVPSLAAAMLERGTTDRSRIELARELEDHGLQFDVRTTTLAPASVTFSLQGLAEELPRMMDLLGEILRRPVFADEELEKLKEQVLGSLLHEREDPGIQGYGELTRQLFPPHHPHRRRPVEEREEEVRALTSRDLEDWHREAYGASTLRCAVVGDVHLDQVSRLLEETLAGWGPGRSDLPVWPGPEPQPSGRFEINIPDRPNLDVYLGHASTLRFGDEDHSAALLANSCLGQSTLTSRLGVAVRDEAGLTYGIHSGFMGTLQIPGPWVTTLGVAAPNLERAISLSVDVIESYVAEGPTDDELNDERRAWAGSYQVGLATNAGVARELVKLMAADQPIDRLDNLPRELMEVSREEVVAALRRHIHPEGIVTVAAGTLPG